MPTSDASAPSLSLLLQTSLLETSLPVSTCVEAESTLNQLLTCMDGLVTRESGRPVVVIAATNRPEACGSVGLLLHKVPSLLRTFDGFK